MIFGFISIPYSSVKFGNVLNLTRIIKGVLHTINK